MKRFNRLLYPAVALFALATLGQSQELAYPRLGYVFESRSGALLRLVGIPGAAVSMPAGMDLPGLGRVAISNERRYALGVAADPEGVVLVDLAGERAPQRLEIDPAPERIALSPGGGAALLYYPGSGKACVVRGLPAGPLESRCYPVDGEPAALAVSDEGVAIVAAAGGVQLFDGDRSVALPAPVAVKAAAFHRGSDDAVLAAAGETWLAAGVRGTPEFRSLPVAAAAPAAVAFSRDGSRVYVADADEGVVRELTRATSEVRSAACGCRPAGLEPLTGNGVFYLADPDSPVVRLFDGDAPEPRAVFVPESSGGAN